MSGYAGAFKPRKDVKITLENGEQIGVGEVDEDGFVTAQIYDDVTWDQIRGHHAHYSIAK